MLYKINKNKIDEKILNETVDILKNGGVIIYPTDTAYALGCDAGNENAAEKIFKIKKREKGKSLPVIVGDFTTAEVFFNFSKKEKELAEKFWSGTGFKEGTADELEKGKLSIVLKARKNVKIAKSVMAEDGTVAVRVPNSIWARVLSLKLGNPLISTSANAAGAGSCYRIMEIKKTELDLSSIDLILDAGILPRVMTSTIARVENNKILILREGGVKILEI
ncbi:MAG: L-threonylcarbamoyladenylate synthase [bacterium]